MKYKGIIFDRDGTLYDSLNVILRAFDHAIEPFTEKRPTREEWFDAFGPAEMDVIAKFIDPEKKQAAFNRFFDCYRTHFGEIHLYPGMRELLFELKRNDAKLMLFTGGGQVSTRFCLEQTGILHLFDALICGEDVLHPKPAPEGILRLMQEQKLQPGETIVVGDAASDVEAGKAAHTFTAWLCWSENAQSAELNVPPDFTCRSVDELRKVLT
jgi:pyrophosphatase PpaX